MKNKHVIPFFSFLVLLGIAIYSCQKDDKSSVDTNLTTGNWQLASVLRFHYLGSSLTSTDTLNTTCDSTQVFKFNADKTCTYSNYHCVAQNASGTWTLTNDKLFLECLITCKDTLPGGAITPAARAFVYCKIITLGPYSLLFQTGDVGGYYTATTVRTTYQYGFVHITKSTK